MRTIKVIARDSRLSQIQVREVFDQIPELSYEVSFLPSYGDKHKGISLLDGKAPADIFTRELDDIIVRGEADIAIHSAKDLPYPLDSRLEVIALFPPFDTTDSLVSRQHIHLADLSSGSTIGTSSPLRKKGLQSLRPDLTIVGIRGTIEERVQQVRDGKIDAAIVATCALKRLCMEDKISEILPFETHPLQGYLAITAKKKTEDTENNVEDNELRKLFAVHNILNKQGLVTLAGFGPGNPDLLTIAAVKALDTADVIFYDDLIGKDYLSGLKAEKIYVGKRNGKHQAEQSEINRLLLDAARRGLKVVRLKGGDPMMFAHASEEIEYLQSNLVNVKVIPGITTASAFAADTKISLTHRLLSSSVAFVNGHANEPETSDAETLVYYMGAAHLADIASQLLAEGRPLDTPVLLGYNISFSDETFFDTTLQQLANDHKEYPTPLIAMIGDVVGLRHNKAEDIQRTLYTGSRLPVNNTLTAGIFHTPLIEITPLEDDSDIISAVYSLHEYDYLLFTSRYAVKYWLAAMRKSDKDIEYLEGVNIVSIGDITSQALANVGIVRFEQTARDDSPGVIDFFSAKNRDKSYSNNTGRQKRVLIPRSDIALSIIPDGLREAGYDVKILTAYHNRCPQHPRKANLRHIRKIIFTSPSTIDNFIKVYGSLPKETQFETRGQTTETYLNNIQNRNQQKDIIR